MPAMSNKNKSISEKALNTECEPSGETEKKRLPEAGPISGVSIHHPLFLLIFWGAKYHMTIFGPEICRSSPRQKRRFSRFFQGRLLVFLTGSAFHGNHAVSLPRGFAGRVWSRALPMLLGGISGHLRSQGPSFRHFAPLVHLPVLP